MGPAKSKLHYEIAIKVDSGEIPMSLAFDMASKVPVEDQPRFWAETKQRRKSEVVRVFTTPDGKEYLQRHILGE